MISLGSVNFHHTVVRTGLLAFSRLFHRPLDRSTARGCAVRNKNRITDKPCVPATFIVGFCQDSRDQVPGTSARMQNDATSEVFGTIGPSCSLLLLPDDFSCAIRREFVQWSHGYINRRLRCFLP